MIPWRVLHLSREHVNLIVVGNPSVVSVVVTVRTMLCGQRTVRERRANVKTKLILQHATWDQFERTV